MCCWMFANLKVTLGGDTPITNLIHESSITFVLIDMKNLRKKDRNLERHFICTGPLVSGDRHVHHETPDVRQTKCYHHILVVVNQENNIAFRDLF